jgi:hypothetical protein
MQGEAQNSGHENKQMLKTAQEELKSVIEFLKDLIVFAAAIFAFFFNLYYLAVEKDFALKEAYLTIQHRNVMSEAEVLKALTTISQESVKGNLNRFTLCGDDFELILFEREAKGETLNKIRELLHNKLKVDSDWEKVFVRNLSRAGSPFYMPSLEQFILYYSWIIQILLLIFLSQTVQKPHVQASLFKCIRKAYWSVPILFVTLGGPFLKLIRLSYGRHYNGWFLLFVTSVMALGCSLLLFFLIRRTLSQKRMTDVGCYLLISSFFLSFLAILGGQEMVYTTFGTSYVIYLRYVSWFILICIPIIICERILRNKKKSKE